MSNPRLISFFLPQYHPIPENDEWWGRGFTEWTNVGKALPMFEGHQQPRLPTELGYYDLRLPETRAAQTALAREHGIHGFCYYHYWFNGRRLLERPVNETLATGQPDFPFCLCWANENWTRAWDGLERQVLMGQKYGPEDDLDHIRYLTTIFRDPRYIRVHGKPLFLVYRVQSLPDPIQTAMIWREEARKLGLGELFLCAVESRVGGSVSANPSQYGFDAAVEFQPDGLHFPKPVRKLDQYGGIYDYKAVVEKMLAKPGTDYLRFPCVAPGWDNSARRKNNPTIITGHTPELYEQWLEAAVLKQSRRHQEENLVFINAWNEWAEGAYLEPDALWGRGFLEATRRVFDRAGARPAAADSPIIFESAPAKPATPQPAAPESSPSIERAPRVSVCIPTYNGLKYLGEAIQSVLKQSFTHFELIVVDDDSAENPQSLVESFHDPRIRFFRNEVRQGLVGNWNRCLEQARGEYVNLFHQDDLMQPDNLRRKVEALDRHPSAGFVYSDVRVLEADLSVRHERWFTPTEPNADALFPGQEFFRKLIAGENLICCPGVMVRRACFENLGRFDAQLPYTTDWEMWLRISLHHDAAYLSAPLLDYRVHDSNETHRFKGLREFEQTLRAKTIALERAEKSLPGHAELRQQVCGALAEKIVAEVRRRGPSLPPKEVRAYLDLAARAHRSALDHPTFDEAQDWFLGLFESLKFSGSDETQPEELADESQAQFQRAQQLEADGKIPEAISLLEVLSASNPKNFRLWFDLARLLMNAGRLVQAEKSWSVAIDNSTESWGQRGWALAMRGRTLEGLGRIPESLADLAAAGNIALSEHRPDHACEIDEWMCLIQEGRRVPRQSSISKERYQAFCQSSQVLQTVGLAVGRKGLISTRDLAAAHAAWQQLLRGATILDLGENTAAVAGLARTHFEAALQKQDAAEQNRVADGWLAFLAAADAAKIPPGIVDFMKSVAAGQDPVPAAPLFDASIVIPTFNRLDLTTQCLNAVAQHRGDLRIEVIFVDNGSTDGTIEYLQGKVADGHVRAIFNSENLGFARACNLGASAAAAPAIAFLNNDTEVQEGWLHYLLERLNQDPHVAAVSGKLLFPDGTIQHAGVALLEDRQLPDPLVARHIHYRKPVDAPEASEPRTYQALTAACLLVRKSAFEQVGGFDEEYWNGYEDVDLCLALGQQGFKLVYDPRSVVIHHESQSGPERFRKVGANITRLHSKWLGKVSPDFIVEPNGEVIRTEAGCILPYRSPDQAARGAELTVRGAASPLVSIIVLAFNQLEHTRACLKSLRAYTSLPHELIVVDNASTDGTADFLRAWAADHSNVQIISNRQNLGFAAGNNQGLALAKGQCVLLLNNDTVVTPGWIESLLAALQSSPDIGIVGPMSNSVSGPQLVSAVGYKTLGELPEFAHRWRFNHPGAITEASRVVGFCLLARRAVIERIGGLDEQFGSGNFEDDDFCIRARLAGFRSVIAGDCFIHHAGSQTFKGAGIDYRASMLRNWELFCAKWRIQSEIQDGYPTPKALPEGVALSVALPDIRRTHATKITASGCNSALASRWWAEADIAAALAAEASPPPAALPDVAQLGRLDQAREFLRAKQWVEAWDEALRAVSARPFHPEGLQLLADIAHAAGDITKARACAERAREMAPGWKAPSKFLKTLPGKGAPKAALAPLPPFLDRGAKPRLSVCLIARDEAQFIEQCLASVQPIAHQIILVDTGSSDRTVELARQFGPEIHQFTWCDDFSAARNAALAHATGDWVLAIDADEELSEAARTQLLRELNQKSALAFRLPIADAGQEGEGCSYVPRLFRNAPGIHFRGRIHEEPFTSLEPLRALWGLENKLGSAQLTHHGYTAGVTQSRGKIARNLQLLRRAIAESPQDANLLMNLGLELVRSGQLDEGLEQYRAAFRLLASRSAADLPAELRETFLTQFCTYLLRARRFAAISEVFGSKLAKSGPLSASLHYLGALAAMETKQFSTSIEHLRQCLAKRSRPALCPILPEIRTVAPAHCLAVCLHAAEDFPAAAKAFAAALQEDAASVPLRMDYAKFLQSQGEPVEALKLLHQITSEQPSETAAWVLGGEIALSQPGLFEFALEWTTESRKLSPDSPALAVHHADALLLNSQPAAALESLRAVQRGESTSAAARHAARVAACQLLAGESLDPLPAPLATKASHEFIQYYRLLLDRGASAQIETLNARLDHLQPILPQAAELLQSALLEAAA